jgi:hypothetical protein
VLYWAMLEFRQLQWIAARPVSLLRPLELRRRLRDAERVGATAEWLHNLALFAATDFEGFRERRFWREYDALVERFGPTLDYRKMFERERLEDRAPVDAT